MKPTAVAPFFRASVAVHPHERRLAERRLDAAAFARDVRTCDAIFRQNLRRLFAAALLADGMGGLLVFAEGWRSNAVHRRGRARRVVTGSWFLATWLRVLKRRGLLPTSVRAVRRDVSRCTWEEARAIEAIAAGGDVIGVADVPCPSAARAARYARNARVITPAEALVRRATPLSEEQERFWRAVQPRPLEALLSGLVEAPNWVLHGVSEGLRRVAAVDPPLEVRLARRLRRDHSARAISSTASGFSTDARSPTGSPR